MEPIRGSEETWGVKERRLEKAKFVRDGMERVKGGVDLEEEERASETGTIGIFLHKNKLLQKT